MREQYLFLCDCRFGIAAILARALLVGAYVAGVGRILAPVLRAVRRAMLESDISPCLSHCEWEETL